MTATPSAPIQITTVLAALLDPQVSLHARRTDAWTIVEALEVYATAERAALRTGTAECASRMARDLADALVDHTADEAAQQPLEVDAQYAAANWTNQTDPGAPSWEDQR